MCQTIIYNNNNNNNNNIEFIVFLETQSTLQFNYMKIFCYSVRHLFHIAKKKKKIFRFARFITVMTIINYYCTLCYEDWVCLLFAGKPCFFLLVCSSVDQSQNVERTKMVWIGRNVIHGTQLLPPEGTSCLTGTCPYFRNQPHMQKLKALLASRLVALGRRRKI